ncbi:hypothetical protein B7W85_15635 [Allorhizobium ampelinum]|nr:hypothetical protein [Allorhizobium ampelinum]MUO89181.1 hypothetical protein [Agrobacterium vitis]MCF1484191.1 hypothetical protein [Allorhizobium ampelinum]MUZ52652.1 hypothetical protein [Agrobacterium vitis]MUZ92161.1 hypothetical protein [Agrobacterium vitis]
MRARRMTWQMAVHVWCMIAVVAIGFAHKAPQAFATPQIPTEFAAYTLPDGSLPVLCISSQTSFAPEDHGKAHGHLSQSGCEACRIGASILLPMPADTIGVTARASLETASPPVQEPVIARIFPPNSAPRAPPLG